VRVSISRAVALAGAALIVAAIAANQSWLDDHFLPSFFVPRPWYVSIEFAVRLAIACAGVALVIGRARVTALVTSAPALTLQAIVAVSLALLAGEFAIRSIAFRPTEWLLPAEEPRRQVDAQLGWVLVPARTGHSAVSGRSIDYAIDVVGCRVRDTDVPVDRARPTIVFGGESVMFGEGLRWDESVPAQVGAMVGVQTANLAVHGYSTDQTYLRLARELPGFRRPIAVVSIFMTELFGRNLDGDRPHLGPGLVWLPAEHASRLIGLAGLLVPYRRKTTVEQGVRNTREVLRATVRLARDRGVAPLVVVPQFGNEDGAQRRLRERVMPDDVPSVLVTLDPDWRLPWDRHPNARAAHVIAAAVAARLRTAKSDEH
jgi:hypothetical protein